MFTIGKFSVKTKCIFLFVLIKVSSDCGTCATLKFKQSHQIDGLGPAKLTVYPTLASIRSKEAYKQIFHIKSFNTTQFGQPNMLENTGTIAILVCIYLCYLLLSVSSCCISAFFCCRFPSGFHVAFS